MCQKYTIARPMGKRLQFVFFRFFHSKWRAMRPMEA
jgi:hypothetical protein